jgi:hypothetical protein
VPAADGYAPTSDLLDDITTVCHRLESLGLELLVPLLVTVRA